MLGTTRTGAGLIRAGAGGSGGGAGTDAEESTSMVVSKDELALRTEAGAGWSWLTAGG